MVELHAADGLVESICDQEEGVVLILEKVYVIIVEKVLVHTRMAYPRQAAVAAAWPSEIKQLRVHFTETMTAQMYMNARHYEIVLYGGRCAPA
jgi:hypothetical protein